MAKGKRNRQLKKSKEATLLSDFGEIDAQYKDLLNKTNSLIFDTMSSSNPALLMKAQDVYNRVVSGAGAGNPYDGKSAFINVNDLNQHTPYQEKRSNINNFALRRMSETPIINAVIGTRVAEIAKFSRPQRTRFSPGYVIRKKVDGNIVPSSELSEDDKARIRYVTEFVKNCGEVQNKYRAGGRFTQFMEKWGRDSLVLDAGTYEVVRSMNGTPKRFFATDGATYKLIKNNRGKSAEQDLERALSAYGVEYKPIADILPEYVQVDGGQRVLETFYPWELCYMVRNARTDMNSYGYGQSELEILINIVTYMLYGDAYNGNFFTQGAAPKGILKVSGNVNNTRLHEFRQNWMAMVSGAKNAWKVPVIQSDSMEWIDLQNTKADMQFSLWQEYLIRVTCSVYKIDPVEAGFNLSNAGGKNALSESSDEWKISSSKSKGLEPILRSMEDSLNTFIIEDLYDDLCLEFVGIDSESEKEELEMDIKRVQSFMGYKEVRKKNELPPEFEEGDFPLNAQFIQKMQADAQIAEMNGAVDDSGSAGGNPFQEEYDNAQQKSIDIGDYDSFLKSMDNE